VLAVTIPDEINPGFRCDDGTELVEMRRTSWPVRVSMEGSQDVY
jgi:hypothetical protein